MKKLGLLVMPLMAVSFLTNCGGGGSTPTEDVKFSIQESSITVKENNTIEIHLDWNPSGDIIEFSNFTFSLKEQFSITSTVTPGTAGDRPLALTVAFNSALSTNDKGNLSFDYNDKTAKKEGKGKVENININIAGEKPSFYLTDYTVDYDEVTHSAMVELNWEPASDSITFSNLDFAYGEKHAEEVVAEATTLSPANINIKFGDAGLEEDVTGTLSFAYTDTTTGVAGEDKIENITINVNEPPVTTYHISMVTDGTDIEGKDLPTDEAYVGTISVTAEDKILNGLTLVTLKDSNTDITQYCTYDPEQDYKSASLEIPLEHLTNDIEVTVALIDEPEATGLVRWVNYDDSPLVEPYELPVGVNAEYSGDTPTRPATSSYVYQFSGWNPDPATKAVEEGDNNVYKAKFDPVATSNLAANMKLVIPSSNDDLTFSFDCTATKKITVDWGDSAVDNNKSHTYSESGTYNIGIYGEDITTVSAGEKGKDYISELELKNKITAIPDNAFKSCTSLTKAEIPSSVTSLGEYAFAYCTSLSEISTLTNITSISAHAFDSCALNTFIVQTKVTEIGDYAFANCASLESVITALAYDTLKTIGAHAFESCSFIDFLIPNSVTSIGAYAFASCTKLASVSLPENITSIGEEAFGGCDSLTFTEYGNCKYLGNSSNTHLALIKYTSPSITSVTVHSDCKIICDRAMNDADNLITVTIPDNITSIGAYAFRSCAYLTTVNINNSSLLTKICDNAFNSCIALTSINIPNEVTSIGKNAFNACYELASVSISNSSSLVTVGEYAFYHCAKLTSIYIPNKVTSIGECAFSECRELSTVTISSSSSSIAIGNYAFNQCKKIKTIIIPKNVTSIGMLAFHNCSILETVDLTAFVVENPNNIPSLDSFAFYGCDALTALKVANSNMAEIFKKKDGWKDYADKIKVA